MKRIKQAMKSVRNNSNEEGHAYAWGGGGLITVVVIILLIILIFSHDRRREQAPYCYGACFLVSRDRHSHVITGVPSVAGT